MNIFKRKTVRSPDVDHADNDDQPGQVAQVADDHSGLFAAVAGFFANLITDNDDNDDNDDSDDGGDD